MTMLYCAFTQIPLVEVGVMANAMGRRLPKGAAPSSNIAVVGRVLDRSLEWRPVDFGAKEWVPKEGAQKGIEMRQQLR